MEDHLATHANAMLVERAPLHDVGLQAVINFRHKLESEGLSKDKSAWEAAYEPLNAVAYLEDCCGGYAMRE